MCFGPFCLQADRSQIKLDSEKTKCNATIIPETEINITSNILFFQF